MEIRKTLAEDHGQLHDMWMASEFIGVTSVEDSEKGFRRFLSRNPDTCFTAAEKNEVLGAIMSGHDGRVGHLYHLSVKEGHRGEGIGKALTEAALKALKDAGISRADLLMFRENPISGFWASMGFRDREDLGYFDIQLNKDDKWLNRPDRFGGKLRITACPEGTGRCLQFLYFYQGPSSHCK